MQTLLYTILALFAASIGSVLLSGSLLLLSNKWLSKISEYLLNIAGGTLLGSALIGLIPEAAETLALETVMIWLLIGILMFFALEKIILWRTCHDENCERQNHAAAPMIIIGDAFHNAIDGVVIAASFLTSVELGLFVTLSVILHEIPQELGDFGILIKGGYSRRKAMFYNLLSGSTSLISGILAYYLLDMMQSIIPYVITIAAAGFLYISLADLIPEMHKESKPRVSIIQFLLIIAGIAIVLLSAHEH
jgi:zinc and cadmium transporter